MSSAPTGAFFEVFVEIGIIEQLSRSLLEARLPKRLIQPHFGVLNHLARLGDGSTPLELARAFQVPKTSMTHTLAGLEKRGLIEMRPNPADGRSKLVTLTKSGQMLRQETIALLAQDFGGLADQISPETLAALPPLLRELREILDRNRLAE